MIPGKILRRPAPGPQGMHRVTAGARSSFPGIMHLVLGLLDLALGLLLGSCAADPSRPSAFPYPGAHQVHTSAVPARPSSRPKLPPVRKRKRFKVNDILVIG